MIDWAPVKGRDETWQQAVTHEFRIVRPNYPAGSQYRLLRGGWRMEIYKGEPRRAWHGEEIGRYPTFEEASAWAEEVVYA